MPPKNYLLLHPSARLSSSEKAILVQGLRLPSAKEMRWNVTKTITIPMTIRLRWDRSRGILPRTLGCNADDIVQVGK